MTSFDRWYLETYDSFVQFFRNRIAVQDLQIDDAMVGVALVYSWMPTLPREQCRPNFESAKTALSKCLTTDATSEQLEHIKAFVSGSMVATSKFLHFLAPDRYPIWDRRIIRGAYGRTWNTKLDNTCDQYRNYIQDIRDLDLPPSIQARVRQTLPGVSTLRMKEFVLFNLAPATRANRVPN